MNNGTTNENNPTSCSSYSSCFDCTALTTCIWCASNEICKDGTWFPTNDCDDWRWKQCSINGKIPFYVALGLVLLIILCLFGCIFYCCCCCKSKRRQLKHFKDFTSLQVQDREERFGLLEKTPKHPQTDTKRMELSQKYNIDFSKKDDNDV